MTLTEKTAAIEATGGSSLSMAQQQRVGPVEGNAAFTVLPDSKAEAITSVAHDGAEGQVARTRGALSFRLGDFFSGKDSEQMRLTEEGNLGIGTAKPKSRLDVAGTIRAREGFMFSDGSTLKVNEKGMLTRTSADSTVSSAAISTPNRIAKFTDDAGALGDSIVIDTGTGLQLTAAPNRAVDTNVIFMNGNDRTTGMIASSTSSFNSANGPYFAMRGNTYNALPGQRGLFAVSAGAVSSPTGREGSVIFNTGANEIRMLISPTGNVGIGTTTPGQKLSVNGVIESTSGGIKFPDATMMTSASTLSKIVGSRVTISAANSPYAAGTAADIIGVDVTSAPVTVILPAANAVSSGKIIIVKNEAGDASVNNITIQRRGSDFINANQTSVAITFGMGTAAFKFYSDGVSRWYQF